MARDGHLAAPAHMPSHAAFSSLCSSLALAATVATALASGSGCAGGTAFDGGALLTELFVQNDSEVPLSVSWAVAGGGIARDGEVAAPAGERVLLLKELEAMSLLPSEILSSVTVRAQGQSAVLFEILELDDNAWRTDTVDAVRAQYTLVIRAEDLP